MIGPKDSIDEYEALDALRVSGSPLHLDQLRPRRNLFSSVTTGSTTAPARAARPH